MDSTEILVVASRFKAFVATQGMRTSDEVMEPLSDRVRQLCTQAAESAKKSQRKTVMAKDVPSSGASEGDSLVVISKVKGFVSSLGELRTSDDVADMLSGELRRLANGMVEAAKADGRKTVMARDIPALAAAAA